MKKTWKQLKTINDVIRIRCLVCGSLSRYIVSAKMKFSITNFVCEHKLGRTIFGNIK